MSDVKITKEERLKKEKAGLDVLADIYRYAETGFGSIEPGDFMRFKWYGVYQQRPNEGHFMMRIKVPGGRMTSEQLRTVADLTQTYARGIGDITTRQTIQLHWLTIGDMPDIFARLNAVGVTTAGACGDITRNLTSSPAAGFDPQELVDTRPAVDAIQDFFHLNRDFGDLPRKFKIAVEGSPIQSTLPQINDASLIAHKRESDGVVGYHFFVGGGLSLQPFFGQQLDVFVPATELDKIVDVMRAIAECYRDAEQLRAEAHPRPAEVPDGRVGAGEVHRRGPFGKSWRGRRTPPRPALPSPTRPTGTTWASTPRSQPGLHWIGLCILAGRLTDDADAPGGRCRRQVRRAAKSALTNLQNMLIPHIVKTNELDAAQAELAAGGLRLGRAQHPARGHLLHRH